MQSLKTNYFAGLIVLWAFLLITACKKQTCVDCYMASACVHCALSDGSEEEYCDLDIYIEDLRERCELFGGTIIDEKFEALGNQSYCSEDEYLVELYIEDWKRSGSGFECNKR